MLLKEIQAEPARGADGRIEVREEREGEEDAGRGLGAAFVGPLVGAGAPGVIDGAVGVDEGQVSAEGVGGAMAEGLVVFQQAAQGEVADSLGEVVAGVDALAFAGDEIVGREGLEREVDESVGFFAPEFGGVGHDFGGEE